MILGELSGSHEIDVRFILKDFSFLANTMVSVIIIGAGAAGLAAAARLVENGFKPAQITILEALDRIGGRIHTVNYGKIRKESVHLTLINLKSTDAGRDS